MLDDIESSRLREEESDPEDMLASLVDVRVDNTHNMPDQPTVRLGSQMETWSKHSFELVGGEDTMQRVWDIVRNIHVIVGSNNQVVDVAPGELSVVGGESCDNVRAE